MKNLSVIIITFNAEATLEVCLSSVANLSDDIVVVDSFSTDNTPAIAKRFTDRFYQQQWSGYSRQKQLALEKTKHDWVLWIDSDEVVSEALGKEISTCDFSHDGYYLNRKTWYLNRWINHCGWSPDYVLRLFKKDKGRFNNAVIHEGIELNGITGRLTGRLHHYTYRDIRHHIEKMNQFTSLAAEGMVARGKKTGWLKLSFHTFGHFIKTYLVKKGFLDGTAGLIICILSSGYVFLKYAKLWEINIIKKTEKQNIGPLSDYERQ